MQINTFTGNVIVVGDYKDKPCPAGTEYLTAAYKPTILSRIKSWLAKLPLANRLMVSEARAIGFRNFCAILGSASGYVRAGGGGAVTTAMEFKFQKTLEP